MGELPQGNVPCGAAAWPSKLCTAIARHSKGKMVRDFLGLRECGEEKESGGAFDLFGALKAVMLFRGP